MPEALVRLLDTCSDCRGAELCAACSAAVVSTHDLCEPRAADAASTRPAARDLTLREVSYVVAWFRTADPDAYARAVAEARAYTGRHPST